MDRERRLRRKAEFQAVQRQGRYWTHPRLIMRVLPNNLAHSRFGFLVSGRVGGAVTRNLLKRRLREIVRREPLQEGWDVVFIARVSLSGATFLETEDAVRQLLWRGHLSRGRKVPEAEKTEGERT